MARILTADTIETTDGRTFVSDFPSGTVISSTVIRNGTRTSISTSATGILFSGYHNKLLDRNGSYLIIRSSVFGAQYSAGNCGTGVRIGSTWDYGAAYQYDGSWSSTQQTTCIYGYHIFTDVDAGSRNIEFGWNARDGGSNRPFAIFNPNNNDDARLRQIISTMYVQEVIL